MLSQNQRIVFFGSSPITLPLLEEIIETENITLTAIFTQPDRPHGRGQKLTPNEVKAWGLENNVPVLQPEKPDAETVAWLREKKIDLGVVMAYGHILHEDLLAAPRCGMINFHGSLLPNYRGASPIEAAVASGDHQTGVSLMRVVKKMDAGAVLDAERVNIDASETSPEIFSKIAHACAPLIRRNWEILLEDKALWIEQDETRVCYARKLHSSDSAIDFNEHWTVLLNRMRALWVRPGIKADYNGTLLRFSEVSGKADIHNFPCGCIIDILPNALVIAVNGGFLHIEKLQRPGGKWLSPKEFTNGFPMEKGYIFPSVPMLPLVGKTPKF